MWIYSVQESASVAPCGTDDGACRVRNSLRCAFTAAHRRITRPAWHSECLTLEAVDQPYLHLGCPSAATVQPEFEISRQPRSAADLYGGIDACEATRPVAPAPVIDTGPTTWPSSTVKPWAKAAPGGRSPGKTPKVPMRTNAARPDDACLHDRLACPLQDHALLTRRMERPVETALLPLRLRFLRLN